MKKLFFLFVTLFLASMLASCKSTHNSNAGAVRDSSASRGNRGAVDSNKAIGVGVNGQSSNTPETSDTSTTHNSAVPQVTDSVKKKKH